MKITNLKRTLIATLVVMLLGIATNVSPAQTKRASAKKKPTVTYYSVKANKVIRVRMDETITSKTAKRGDTFSVTVREPVYSSSGLVLVPVGSTINASVTAVKKAVRDGEPGMIDVQFTGIALPNGRKIRFNGSLTSLDEGDTKSDSEGTAKVTKTRRRSVKFIGGGAGGGVLIGALAGGGKGALIGGIVGAGGGLLAKLITKGDDAVIKKGVEFGVIVNRAFKLPKYR